MSDKLIVPTVGTPGEVTVECDNCDSKLFTQVYVLKKVPAIMTGTISGGLKVIPLWQCVVCGEVNMELIPVGAGTPSELFGDNPLDDE